MRVRLRLRQVWLVALWARRLRDVWTHMLNLFQSHGGSMVMLAKGNRSQQVTDACKKYGGFYLGSIGGPAAILAQNNIKSIECVEYPELGMEAIWKIEVEELPRIYLGR